MTRRTAALATIVTIAALCGCTAEAGPEPRPASAEAKPEPRPASAEAKPEPRPASAEAEPDAVEANDEPEPSTPSREDFYLEVLRSSSPGNFVGTPNHLAIRVGKTTCEVFDQGARVSDVVALSIAAGFREKDAGTLIGASVSALCPRHLGQLENFIENH